MATAQYDADLKLFVNGAWRAGEDRQPVFNPATGATVAEVPLATAADLDEALAAADRGFKLWRATDVEARAAILHKAAALIRERADRIATLMTMEQGKPIGEARGEVAGSAQLFDYYAEEAKRAYGRVLVRPTGQRSIVIKQPVGPVASFTPWNFPVYLMAKKLAAALAAGCSVIAKPPEETPGCTSAIMQALADAGLPAGVAQLVFGVPDTVSRHLLASPVIRKVSFTGSVPVGRHLMKLAADGLKRVTMELGGHAPVLIFDDCDLERTLDMVVPQKFRNAGQVCVSPTRFYVQQGVYDRFVSEFAARTQKWQVGDGLEPATKMGPLANKRRPDAIEVLVEDAVAKGAKLAAGGERFGDGFFYKPTLLADVPLEARVMNEEPFGPVAVARPFATEEEAIEQANRLPYGLAAFAFTENGRRANRLGDLIEAGMVGINTFAISGADTPFGGVKDSGFGSEGGPEGLDSYMVVKAIHQA
ncbi:aldehyde dehydrogenase family protein [Sphingomonas sp. MAH-20]|uniref:Aldehyde dehydrogenase family protein n=1 Tax=Sphingomonas horti TaxID=2682842 RepID=A0A6I4J2V0_9SPHN|nr:MULTISPECIES: NAD-dependent succinate-semialdehyde dehydrogenase [Sphingomonas]MBA2919528.1 NAD-dependent succinate-semialdehyde dehydrogenase [Sphingomonas sp. CGMCC 1.13658]MVO78408.1 aldehyde dehydrogenase family protein [Sphingomonas horti]